MRILAFELNGKFTAVAGGGVYIHEADALRIGTVTSGLPSLNAGVNSIVIAGKNKCRIRKILEERFRENNSVVLVG